MPITNCPPQCILHFCDQDGLKDNRQGETNQINKSHHLFPQLVLESVFRWLSWEVFFFHCCNHRIWQHLSHKTTLTDFTVAAVLITAEKSHHYHFKSSTKRAEHSTTHQLLWFTRPACLPAVPPAQTASHSRDVFTSSLWKYIPHFPFQFCNRSRNP